MSNHVRGGAATEHFVSTTPFDPYTIEELTAEQERYHMASQWRMMWWRLKRHRVAVVSGEGRAFCAGLDTSGVTDSPRLTISSALASGSSSRKRHMSNARAARAWRSVAALIAGRS